MCSGEGPGRRVCTGEGPGRRCVVGRVQVGGV